MRLQGEKSEIKFLPELHGKKRFRAVLKKELDTKIIQWTRDDENQPVARSASVDCFEGKPRRQQRWHIWSSSSAISPASPPSLPSRTKVEVGSGQHLPPPIPPSLPMSLLGWFTLSSDRCCEFILKLERLFFEKTGQSLGAQRTAFPAMLFFVDGASKDYLPSSPSFQICHATSA